jgi:hypothetical protein
MSTSHQWTKLANPNARLNSTPTPEWKLAARIVQLQIDAANNLQPWGAKTLTEVGPTRNHFYPEAFLKSSKDI